jgi:hypothetical protein
MRRLSSQLVGSLQPSDGDDVIPAVGRALSGVRGRPVRLRKVAFPPATASGLWIDRTSHDVIAYEENTDPEHQLVIIGHEAWHMFQGHCGSHMAHGSTALRAVGEESAATIRELVAVVSDAADLPPTGQMDAALHVAARANASALHEEVDAEHFGVRFATDLQTALAEARYPADPKALAGRIQATMAHRIRRI